MVIKVGTGKGNKDRYTLLSEKLLEELREYYTEWRPKEFLFEGSNGGRYSAESIAKIVKDTQPKLG